jgi:endonuclease III
MFFDFTGSVYHANTRDGQCMNRNSLSQLVVALRNIGQRIEIAEFFPAVIPGASAFAVSNPYAFLVASCLDRGTKSEIIWTIPFDLNQELGHLDARAVAAMPLAELDAVFKTLPRKPRYLNDAAQTILGLSRLIVDDYAGDARHFISSCTAEEFQIRLKSLKGVGPGIASMTVQLVLRVYGPLFRSIDLSKLDIKPDVHTRRVLYRLGVTQSDTDEAAVAGARLLNPEDPGGLDASLWWIGNKWCRAQSPNCSDCAVLEHCQFPGGRTVEPVPPVAVKKEREPVRVPASKRQEADVDDYVHSEFGHVEELYRMLAARLSNLVPALKPELDSGGPGWIKFWNSEEGRYARFGVALKKKACEIEIFFRSNAHAPDPSDVDTKSVRSAMHRKSGKGFYVSAAEQVDSDVISWIVDAS